MEESMELFEEDFYLVENPNIRIDLLDFFALYQPLLGQKAISLFVTLYSESRQSDFNEHRRLCKLMNLSIDEIEEAREVLEKYSLVKTFYNEVENEYVYRLIEPLSNEKFLNHAVFGLQYQNMVGLTEFEHAKKLYAPSSLKLRKFKDISAKLDREALSRISESEVKAFLDLKGEEVSEDKSFGFNSYFDYQAFIKPLTALSFPFEARTTESLRFIGRLSTMTNMDMNRLRELSCQSVNMDTKTLDKDRLLRAVLREEGKSVKAKPEGYSVDPFTFLLKKQEDLTVSKSSRTALEYLVNDTNFSTEVVNILVEYVLDNNNGILYLPYVQSVAETFARNEVKSETEAKTLVKKLKKEKKTSVQREVRIHQPSYQKEEETEESEEEVQKAIEAYEAYRRNKK